MSVNVLLDRLRTAGVRLRIDQGALRFKAPAGAMTAELRAAIQACRPELVALLSAARGREIERGSEGPWPLTFAQRRMWFAEQLDGIGATYTICGAARSAGALDEGLMAAALAQLARRHSALRTAFRVRDGVPEQFLADATLELEQIDFTCLDAQTRKTRTDALLEEIATTRFDLSQAPLARAVLVRLAADEHIIAIAQHHIVSDGISVGILMRELSELYAAAKAGRSPALPTLALSYGDVAKWQQRPERAHLVASHVARQAELLRGTSELLEIPTDQLRQSAGQSFRGALAVATLPAAVGGELRALARGEQATTFMVLLSIFSALLGRYARADDVVIGAIAAGREHPDVAPLVGLFVNTVPVRCRVDGDPTGRQLLARIRDAALAAFANQEAPLEQIVDALGHRRDPRYQPVCQALLVLQNAHTEQLELSGARLSAIRLPHRVSRADLMLSVEEPAGGSMRLELEYCGDLFSADRMNRLLEHFITLAAAVATEPDRPVKAHPLLSATEGELIQGWSGTPGTIPHATVAEAFARIVRATPDATAVVAAALDRADPPAYLTYAEVDDRSSRLAGKLIALGVGPGDAVAVLIRRSLSVPVALLAVLKAGAAYVPLDPERIDPRWPAILADAAPRAVLTDRPDALDGRVPPGTPMLDPHQIDGPPAPSVPVERDALAALLFTSGSTGGPKGVRVTQRNIVQFVAGIDLEPQAGADAVLHYSSVAFDVATFELWYPLLTGRRVVIAPAGQLSGEELAEVLRRYGVSTAWLTAGLFHRLADDIPDALAGLNWLCTGGDVVSPEHCQTVLDRMTAIGNRAGHVMNAYGPTECTTFATLSLIPAGSRVASPLSIGRPMPNANVHVVEPSGCRCPIGVPGELLIGGGGVAAGYLKRPDLTAQRFVTLESGERVYRTGDLVSWRSDGTLDFLGRIDQQIKLRGFRIEPAEIEEALRGQPGVTEAAVVVVKEPSNRLIGYVVMDRSGTAGDADRLRDALTRTLPDYMVPSSIVVLDALPLGTTGKVDRGALTSMAADGQPPQPTPIRMPSGEAERAVGEVWRTVLDIADVSPEDNFFRLGGDSILAMRVVARLASAGWRVSVRDLLEHQELGKLARAATPLHASASAEPAPIEDRSGGPMVMSPIQRAFFERAFELPDHWNQALLLAVRGVSPSDVERALTALVARHDALRQRFVRDSSGTIVATVESAGPAPKLRFVDLSALDPDAAVAVQEAEATRLQSSLSLADGRLLASAWFDRGATAGPQLLLVIHHLAVDIVSWSVLIEELDRLCTSLVPLPLAGTGYRNWASALAAGANGRDAEIAAWTRWPAVPELPSDHDVEPDEANLDEASALTASAMLDRTATATLLTTTAAAFRATPTELFLAAVAGVFGAWGRVSALRIDLERHGRDAIPEIDASRLVGWCTAVVPLRLACASGDRALIEHVKDRLAAAPDGGIGWGQLRYVHPDPAVRTAVSVQPAPIAVNFLGRLDTASPTGAAFALCEGPVGPSYAAGAERSHAFEVIGAVSRGELRVDVRFSPATHAAATGTQLATAIRDTLARFAGTRGSSEIRARADLPAPRVDDESVAAVLHALRAHDDPHRANPFLEAVHPLSHQQQGMLVESLLGTSSDLHLEQLTFTLEGVVDVRALERAWSEVARRQPILRTGFFWRGLRAPVQAIFRDALPRISRVQLPDGGLDAWLAQDRCTPLDLDRPGVFRLSVLDDGRQQHLVWTFHHIVLDGWSVALVLRDVVDAYRGAAHADAADPLPYGAFVEWLSGRDLAETERFWRAELAGLAPLPARDHPLGSQGQADLVRELQPAAAASLHAAARRAGVSLNTIVQAAWALVVARLNDRTDIAFSTTAAGRPQLPEFDETAGLFIDTLPFRVSIPADGPIDEWLCRLQRRHGELRLNGHVPFGAILAWCGLGAGAELCNTLLVFENYPQSTPDAEPGALRIGTVRSHGARTRYPLTLLVSPSDGALRVHLVYDRAEFNDDLARAIFDCFEAAAERIAATGARLEHLTTFSGLPRRNGRTDADRASGKTEAIATAAAAESSAVETAIRDVWEALFGRRVPPGASFVDLGGHSLMLLQLVMRLRERFGPDVDLATVAAAPTVEQMAAALSGAIFSDRSPLVPLNAASGSATPLVIVPGASGNPFAYTELARHLNRPVTGVRLLAGGPSSVVELAEQLVDRLPPATVHLAGHSFGAAVALEAARLRLARGFPPGLLVMIDVAAPAGTPLNVPSDESELLAAIADAAGRFFRTPLELDRASLAGLDAPLRRALLVDRFISAGFVPPGTTAAFADELLSIYRTSCAAYGAWHPAPLHGQEIIVVRAQDGSVIREHPGDPTLGWQHLTGGNPAPRCVEVPGDHITMIAQPNATQLASILNDLLATVGEQSCA